MSAQASVQTITPKLAHDWLEKFNQGNRPVSQAVVDKYADDMKHGRWQLNGEPIIFGMDGRLLNGQHRLWACALSGTNFQTIVTRGITDEAFRTLDSGKNRSTADALYLLGHQKYSTRIAAAAKFCWLYENTNVYGEHNAPRQLIINYVEENQGLIPIVSGICGNQSAISTFASPISAVCYIGSHSRPDRVEDFYKPMMDGAGLTSGDPRLALRNKIIQEGSDRQSSMRGWDRMMYVTMAWNAFCKGKTLTKVQRSTSSEFPRIEGAKK